MKVTGFHLPHNAILPEESLFMLKLIDVNKEYYLYDDLKSIFFEEQVKSNKFKMFHKNIYNKIMNATEKNPNLFKIKLVYKDIERGEKEYKDIEKLQYTKTKKFGRIWNETVRDYIEFFAFCGLMPSYYKGKTIGGQKNEKRHYIGYTLKKFKNKEIDFTDVLLNMKFRNASKNYVNLSDYDIKNRPFVNAIRIMDFYCKKGYSYIDAKVLQFLIRNIKDEDNTDQVKELLNNTNPVDISNFTKKDLRELSRGDTFMYRYLTNFFDIDTSSKYRRRVYKLESKKLDYLIKKFKLNQKALFIGERFGELEVTPNLLRYLKDIKNMKDNKILKMLEENNLVKAREVIVKYNVDTDLAERSLAEEVYNPTASPNVDFISNENILDKSLIDKGKKISQGSNGTVYEEFLYKMLNEYFEDINVVHLGSNSLGKRLSDLYLTLDIIDGNEKRRILLVIEAKAGNAIKSLDDRKESENIINTIQVVSENVRYDGIWVMFVNGNSIPKNMGHGGFRLGNSNLQKSFYQKLISVQSSIMMNAQKLTLVSAFSYDEFIKFLDSINYSPKKVITKVNTPQFWTWSSKFVNESYASILN